MKLLHALRMLERQSVVLCPATFRAFSQFDGLERTLHISIHTKGSFKTLQSRSL